MEASLLRLLRPIPGNFLRLHFNTLRGSKSEAKQSGARRNDAGSRLFHFKNREASGDDDENTRCQAPGATCQSINRGVLSLPTEDCRREKASRQENYVPSRNVYENKEHGPKFDVRSRRIAAACDPFWLLTPGASTSKTKVHPEVLMKTQGWHQSNNAVKRDRRAFPRLRTLGSGLFFRPTSVLHVTVPRPAAPVGLREPAAEGWQGDGS